MDAHAMDCAGCAALRRTAAEMRRLGEQERRSDLSDWRIREIRLDAHVLIRSRLERQAARQQIWQIVPATGMAAVAVLLCAVLVWQGGRGPSLSDVPEPSPLIASISPVQGEPELDQLYAARRDSVRVDVRAFQESFTQAASGGLSRRTDTLASRIALMAARLEAELAAIDDVTQQEDGNEDAYTQDTDRVGGDYGRMVAHLDWR